jgi:1,4-alpha-glucan branching enzyme
MAMIFDKNLNNDIIKIIEARHHDPFSILGLHQQDDQAIVRAFLPDTLNANIDGELPMSRIEGTDMFVWQGDAKAIHWPYKIHRERHTGDEVAFHDPYSIMPQLSEYDLHLFSEGKHWHAYKVLGAHVHEVEGIKGTLFAT